MYGRVKTGCVVDIAMVALFVRAVLRVETWGTNEYAVMGVLGLCILFIIMGATVAFVTPREPTNRERRRAKPLFNIDLTEPRP